MKGLTPKLMVSYEYPQIRIQYAWLLAMNASEGLNELRGDGTPLMSYDYYSGVAKKYEKSLEAA